MKKIPLIHFFFTTLLSILVIKLHFFAFYLQVCSVLDSLEREYKREDDMLQKHLSSGDVDKVTLITQLISKHQEQKEAFLKACTLARRTAETFLKYSNRSLQFFSQPSQSTFKGPEAKVKGILNPKLAKAGRKQRPRLVLPSQFSSGLASYVWRAVPTESKGLL